MNKLKAGVAALVVTLGALGGMTTPQPAEAEDGFQICYFTKATVFDHAVYFKKNVKYDCQDYRAPYYDGVEVSEEVDGSNPTHMDCGAFTRWKNLDVDSSGYQGVNDICNYMMNVEEFYVTDVYTERSLQEARPRL